MSREHSSGQGGEDGAGISREKITSRGAPQLPTNCYVLTFARKQHQSVYECTSVRACVSVCVYVSVCV